MQKWRCPYCRHNMVFRLYLNGEPLRVFACGNCGSVVNATDLRKTRGGTNNA